MATARETRLSFQFMTRANSSWELDRLRSLLADRPVDVAFVQCPIYEYFKPDAYNYALSKQQRNKLSDEKLGPRHLEAMGSACIDYIKTVQEMSPEAPIFLLGTTPLPAWTKTLGGEDIEFKVFQSINTALGLRCHGTTDNGMQSSLRSSRGIVPIDRYAIVGPRRRDMIHPFFNAQFGIGQMMLNHMC
ncbi:MAG: hypothetical protein SGPRY_000701 [Prymnesium sp.]